MTHYKVGVSTSHDARMHDAWRICKQCVTCQKHSLPQRPVSLQPHRHGGMPEAQEWTSLRGSRLRGMRCVWHEVQHGACMHIESYAAPTLSGVSWPRLGWGEAIRAAWEAIRGACTKAHIRGTTLATLQIFRCISLVSEMEECTDQ